MSPYAHLALRLILMLRLRLRLRRSSLFLCKPLLPELRHPFIASVLLSPVLCSSDVCLVGLRGLGCGHFRSSLVQQLRRPRQQHPVPIAVPAGEQSERGQLQAQRGTPPSLLQRLRRIGPFYSATRFWSTFSIDGYYALFSPVLIGAERHHANYLIDFREPAKSAGVIRVASGLSAFRALRT